MRDERGSLVFIDESGLLMAPLVRRTWARRGCTPELLQRGRHREKISLAAALWLTGDVEPTGLSYRSIADGHFNNIAVAAFLDDLLLQTRRPITVVWDNGNMHRGEPIRELLARHGGRLNLERLPPYAPTLNPIEHLWSWLKYGRLCNFAPVDLGTLHQAIQRELRNAQRSERRLESLWTACDLSPRRTLLI